MRTPRAHTRPLPRTWAWPMLAAGLSALALLVPSAVLVPSAAAATTGPSLAVSATSSDHHAISPDIYGMNFADKATAKRDLAAGGPLGWEHHRHLQLQARQLERGLRLVLREHLGLLVDAVQLVLGADHEQRRSRTGTSSRRTGARTPRRCSRCRWWATSPRTRRSPSRSRAGIRSRHGPTRTGTTAMTPTAATAARAAPRSPGIPPTTAHRPAPVTTKPSPRI